jgi:purine-binding chemotaxis protein CheW
MHPESLYLIFQVAGTSFGLRFAAVQRVLPMVEVTPLPQAPRIVDGVVNVAGRIVPVLSLRRRLGLPAREARLSDVLILAHTRQRLVALHGDGIGGLVQREPMQLTPAADIHPGLQHIEGVVKLDDGVALIHDLDRFLSLDEQVQLDRSLDAAREPGA